MYTITDSTQHQMKTPPPPPTTSTLADHTGSLSLIQHDVDIGFPHGLHGSHTPYTAP